MLTRLARKARIIICGAISQYNNTTPVQGPKNYLSLLVNRARMEGMVVFDYADRYPDRDRRAGRLPEGRAHEEQGRHRRGIDTFPETLLKLFSGENFGKLVLQSRDGLRRPLALRASNPRSRSIGSTVGARPRNARYAADGSIELPAAVDEAGAAAARAPASNGLPASTKASKPSASSTSAHRYT